jgi:hypothetical protein
MASKKNSQVSDEWVATRPIIKKTHRNRTQQLHDLYFGTNVNRNMTKLEMELRDTLFAIEQARKGMKTNIPITFFN